VGLTDTRFHAGLYARAGVCTCGVDRYGLTSLHKNIRRLPTTVITHIAHWTGATVARVALAVLETEEKK
jgi:hypothetical protein